MLEVDIQQVNIKKKKSNRPIYFGIDKDTGELLAVSSVSRGLSCNCLCVSCNTRLEARKGNVKKHHFAHETNQECLYGAEIAVYQALCEAINQLGRFYIPDAILTFNSYKKPELVKPGSMLEPVRAELHKDNTHYPPALLCHFGSSCLQIILNIEQYYNEGDYRQLKENGIQNDIPIVAINLEDLDSITTLEDLQPYIEGSDNKHWVYNRLVEIYKQKYQEAAVAPPEFREGHICLAQKNRHQNVYSARLVDCIHCPYCYDYCAEKFCLAPNYINHIEDFIKPVETRKQEFHKENNLKPIKKIDDYSCPICNAPMRQRNGPNGIFAGCSNYPKCRGSLPVEPATKQVIIYDKYKNRRRNF